MGLPGIPELSIIAGVIVLLFGAKKLPQFGGAMGETIRNWRRSMREVEKLTEGDNG